MKRHQDNSILPSSSPAPGLRRASELELAPCLQPPNYLAERLPRLLRASPSTALDELFLETFQGTRGTISKNKRLSTAQILDVIHLRPALGLRANLLKI